MVFAIMSSYQLTWVRRAPDDLLLISRLGGYGHTPQRDLGADSLDSERFGYGSNFGDEQPRLFPSTEVAASLGLTPVHDLWEPGFGPSAVGAWYLLVAMV